MHAHSGRDARRWLFPASMAALLLLVVIAGIVFFARRRGGEPRRESGGDTATDAPATARAVGPAFTAGGSAAAVAGSGIEPADGATIRGADTWVRWVGPPVAQGQVTWRRAGGEGEFRVAPAAADGGDGASSYGTALLARLEGLQAGAYEYIVEHTAGGLTQRSALRTFTVKPGVAFVSPVVEATVKRDYDQAVTLRLRNDSAEAVKVAAAALGAFADLPADIVGAGSADEPVELAPGKEIDLRLAVTAPDATRATYDIPVRAAGASALVRVRIDSPRLQLSFREISTDPRTLAKTVEIRNGGDAALADFSIAIAAPHELDVRIEPAVSHAYLQAGGFVRVTLSPILYLEFQKVEASLECRAGGQSSTHPVQFQAPPGRQLLGVRTGTQQRNGNGDFYCTNRPNTCSIVPGPDANGPVYRRPRRGGPLPKLGLNCEQKKKEECACDPPYIPSGIPSQFPGFPGTTFDCEAAAAARALEVMVVISRQQNREYSGYVKYDPSTGKYYWTLECIGSKWCVTTPPCPSPSSIMENPGAICVSHWHTHGRADKDAGYEGFSDEDVSDTSWTHREYLGTPSGRVLVYPIVRGGTRGSGATPGTPGYGPAANVDPNAPCNQSLPGSHPGAPPEGAAAPGTSFVRPAAAARVGSAGPHPSLIEALGRRGSFSRDHRGPFAAPVEGDLADSSGVAAGFHAGAFSAFAYHAPADGEDIALADEPVIRVARFDPAGRAIGAVEVLGAGRWPRLAGDGERLAVAWRRGAGSVARLFDGKEWGSEIALDGAAPAIAFAAGGSFYAATSTGLWKLDGQAFQPMRPAGGAAWSQPALAIDEQGRPHVAYVREGRLFAPSGTGETEVDLDAGQRPTLAIGRDGAAFLAYLADGELRLRHRSPGASAWTEPQRVSAQRPDWPGLAEATDGMRLTYIDAAERGPDALWLLRLGNASAATARPILMPSLEGNITDAWLLLHFRLRSNRWHYRPHDVYVTFNDVSIGSFLGTVPEGRFLFKLDPAWVFSSPGRAGPNRVAIRTRHMNGGQYMTSSDYELITRTEWSESFAFAIDEQDARLAADRPGMNHDRPDLAVLANALQVPARRPAEGTLLEFSVVVANLGEAPSAPAGLVTRNGKTPFAFARVPALRPGEQWAGTMRLDGTLDSVTFALEQGRSDFDPENDTLTLALWPSTASTPAKAAVSVATTASRALLSVRQADGRPVEFGVESKAGKEVARADANGDGALLEAGEYTVRAAGLTIPVTVAPRPPAKGAAAADLAAMAEPYAWLADVTINTNNANLMFRESDGQFRRWYNSRSLYDGPFGFGWTFDYGTRLSRTPEGAFTVHENDGFVSSYLEDGDRHKGVAVQFPSYLVAAGTVITRFSDAEGYHRAYGRRITTERFDRDGRLMTVRFADGAEHEVRYVNNQLDTVVEKGTGKRLYAFKLGSGKVRSVIDSAGREYSYKYRDRTLIEVSQKGAPAADATTTYAYSAGLNVISIRRPNGSEARFEYDEARDWLTSMRAGALNYAFAYGEDGPSRYWTTRTDADGNVTRWNFTEGTPGGGLVTSVEYGDGIVEPLAPMRPPLPASTQPLRSAAPIGGCCGS